MTATPFVFLDHKVLTWSGIYHHLFVGRFLRYLKTLYYIQKLRGIGRGTVTTKDVRVECRLVRF
jgi:hypothetical protein